MRYVLFNPLSSTCIKGDELIKRIKSKGDTEELTLVDVTTIKNVDEFVKSLKSGDDIVISGGDGTLNHMINAYDFKDFPHNIYLYKAGNGNDFLRDINELSDDFISLNPYLNNLPTVEVNGKTYKYINGIGFGIDGLVCVETDKMKKEGKTNINYTTVSIKLLLTSFKRVNAKVDVDGKHYEFKNVWLASAMNGKYYGGGMKVAPDQDRLSDELTVCVWHDLSKLPALMMFPKIFKGEHVKNKKKVTILKGKDIKVTFDKPTGLQIDGESFDNITTYSAHK